MHISVNLLHRCAIRAIFVCFFALALSAAAFAQTVSCPVTTSGTVPGGTTTMGASVCVVESGVILTVGLTGDVENFLNESTVQNGNLIIPGSTILNDGTIVNSGAIYNYGGTTPSTITNFGTIINKNILDNTGYFLGNSVLTNAGILTNEDFLYSGVLNNVGTLTNTGTLEVTSTFSFDPSTNPSLTNFVSGTLNNTGTITIDGGANLLNSGTFTNFVGGVVSNGGLLTNGGTLVNDGTVTTAMGGLFTNTGSFTSTGTVVNDGNFNASNGSSFTNSGAFVNNGGEMAEFITVLGATTSITNNGSFGNSGTLDIGAGPLSSPGVVFYNNAGATLANSNFLGIGGTAGTIIIDNGSSLINYGTLANDSSVTEFHASVLTNYGTFTNDIGSGLLVTEAAVLNNYGAFTNNGSVSISAGSTLNNFAGSSFIQKSGITVVDGTLNSVPAVQFQGGFLIGTGSINGNVNFSSGFISPGDQLSDVFTSNGTIPTAGTLTINGNYTQGSSGTLGMFLAGGPGGELNLLDVSGLVTLDGYVDFFVVNGFTPVAGDDFTFLDFGSLSGDFAGFNPIGWSCPTADTCELVYGANSVSLDILGPSGSGGNGGDGTTNAPEPSSVWLLCAALLALIACSRAKRISANA